jgi:hypothetical protein
MSTCLVKADSRFVLVIHRSHDSAVLIAAHDALVLAWNTVLRQNMCLEQVLYDVDTTYPVKAVAAKKVNCWQ